MADVIVDMTGRVPAGRSAGLVDDSRPADVVDALRQPPMLKAEMLQDAILNSASFAIIATDAEGVIQLFNIGAERLLGHAASDVVNKMTPSDIHDPHEVIARAKALSAEFATTITPGFGALAFKASRGIEDKYESTYIRKDGSRFPAKVSITALRGDKNEIIGYLLIGTDNSAARLVQLAAEREKVAEEMFHQAVESCPNGMVMTSSAGRIVLVNGEIERMFGYRREELIGQSIDKIVPGHLHAEQVQRRDMFISNSNIRHLEADHVPVGRRKDGCEFPVEVGLNPIHTGDDLMVLSVIVDISERKRIERLKDEFVSTVSHELRTPLTSISGALGLLTGQLSGKLSESASRLLTIANKNSQRLVRLINDILDIEKLESGRAIFNLSQVYILSLVEQAIEENRGFAESHSVSVRLNPASADGKVNVDPDRLSQVITNLLSNAIKFSPKTEDVLVAVEKDGEMFRISVRDHGSGVPDKFKSHIFEKFAQAEATDARQKGGTGLGLSIVKQIVTWFGGKVGFADAPGGGTIFNVDLPAWNGAANGEIDPDAKPDAIRILVCEDERAVATILRMRLRPAGFSVDFAHTIAAAITRADATPYAAMLVDLRFPDGDGLDLIFRLRELAGYRDTPMIVISGDPAQGQDDVRSSRLKIFDWIGKPIDFENLFKILRASIAPQPHRRPRILHVDDDYEVLAAVTRTLSAIADVVSADTIESARRALSTEKIDLAVLDISLGGHSGLELLPDLRDSRGNAIPVIIFSAQDAGLPRDEQIQAALCKSNAPLASLVSTVRDRLAHLPTRTVLEVA
ncbi:MAG: sensor hybrid histidine kinase [Xanthobacteraceae bacterium]|nr:sensor hybrid histidine kinase [Xanthobacteraceae bacterium]